MSSVGPSHFTNAATTASCYTYGLHDLSEDSVAVAADVTGGYQLPHHQRGTFVGNGMAANLTSSAGEISKKRKATSLLGDGSNLSDDLKPSSSSVKVRIVGASTPTATLSRKSCKRGRQSNAALASGGKFSLLIE